MENEDLELLGDEDPELEELKTIDQYFDQCLKDSPVNIKISEYNLEQAMQGDNAPTVILANKILLKALQENATEIRIIPLDRVILVRFNQGSGFYKPSEMKLLVNLIEPIANIIRLKAGMEKLARNKPVVGKMLLIYHEKRKEVVIHTLSSTYGTSLSLFLKDG